MGQMTKIQETKLAPNVLGGAMILKYMMELPRPACFLFEKRLTRTRVLSETPGSSQAPKLLGQLLPSHGKASRTNMQDWFWREEEALFVYSMLVNGGLTALRGWSEKQTSNWY